MKIMFLAFALVFPCQGASAQQKLSEPTLAPLQFLLGKWEGEGSAEAGRGSGYFSFETSLQDKVLIRKNHSQYRQARDRPVYRHDDLMIVYVDAATKQMRAFYTDNEQHVINYAISVSGDGSSVVFISDAQTSGPRYRLTYAVTQPGKMSVTLEAAQPDKPDQFQKVVEGKVKKIG
jgi:hypothetical protein